MAPFLQTIRKILPQPERDSALPEAVWGAALYWLALPAPGKIWLLHLLGWIALLPWCFLITRKTLRPTKEFARRGPLLPAAGEVDSNSGTPLPPDKHAADCKRRDAAHKRMSPAIQKEPRSESQQLWSPWPILTWLISVNPFWQIWMVSFLFWLVTLHWLRYPHPLVTIGWIALSFYLAFYLPVFIAIGRAAVHRFKIPSVLAVPVVWTGLEYLRAHLLTGFTLASLCHTQYRIYPVLQICDLAGQYALSFVMAWTAAGFAEVFRQENWKKRGAMLVVALTPVLGTASYALWRLHQQEPGSSQIKVALVQGSVDVVFPPPPGTNEKMHQQYWELSLAAVRNADCLDLIIWPETVYGEFLIDGTPEALPPPQWQGSVAEFHEALEQAIQASREHLYTSAKILGMPMIVGINRQEWTAEGPKIYNSAVLVPLLQKEVALLPKHDSDPLQVSHEDQSKGKSAFWNSLSAQDSHFGEASRENLGPANATSFTPPIEVYDKLHLVMFGEYVPFARYFEGLIELTPLSTLQVNTEPGQKPKCFVVGKAQLVPNICFESTVPHLIRRQLRELRKAGFVPNALVNLTNDGWFWGSAALDLHLACSVFRAVEFRKPHLIAANTGISAWVDSKGSIRAEAPRRTLQVLLADVTLDDQVTMYLVLGDWFGILCLGFAAVVLCIEFFARFRIQKKKDISGSK